MLKQTLLLAGVAAACALPARADEPKVLRHLVFQSTVGIHSTIQSKNRDGSNQTGVGAQGGNTMIVVDVLGRTADNALVVMSSESGERNIERRQAIVSADGSVRGSMYEEQLALLELCSAGMLAGVEVKTGAAWSREFAVPNGSVKRDYRIISFDPATKRAQIEMNGRIEVRGGHPFDETLHAKFAYEGARTVPTHVDIQRTIHQSGFGESGTREDTYTYQLVEDSFEKRAAPAPAPSPG